MNNANRRWIRNILSEHHENAFHWARQCCYGDEDLALDVLQNVYLKILEGKAKFKEKSAIKTWLFSIIRFTAIDALKRQKINLQLDAAMMVEAELNEAYDDTDWKHLINHLSEKQRDVVLLHFYHDMTLESISELMHISIGSVRTHYDRGKKKLRMFIEKMELIDNR